MTHLELFDGAGAPVASPRIAQNGAETAAQDVPGVPRPPRRPAGALGLPWRPPACRFRPAARSPAGAPAIGRRAATTGPRPMASVPTPRPELPAAGGVRNRPVERGGGVPHVDGTGDRGMAHRCRRRDSLDRASAASTPPAARTTDVCLVIDPAADSHYCPDCLLGAVPLWDATAGNHPRVAKCRDCGSVFVLVFVHRRRAARRVDHGWRKGRREMYPRMQPRTTRFHQ